MPVVVAAVVASRGQMATGVKQNLIAEHCLRLQSGPRARLDYIDAVVCVYITVKIRVE